MPVIDRTGDNAKCYKCDRVVGREIVNYNNIWLCKRCLKSVKENKKEEKARRKEIERKMKKRGRTAKKYIMDKLEGNPGIDFYATEIAEELVEECITSKDSTEDAKKTVSITISMLRKEGFPIERTGRGVYRWRSPTGMTKKEEDAQKEKEVIEESKNILFGEDDE